MANTNHIGKEERKTACTLNLNHDFQVRSEFPSPGMNHPMFHITGLPRSSCQ